MDYGVHYSIAQLSDVFREADVKKRNGITTVRVVEDSEQEFFLRHVQMRARSGTSRFCKEFHTLNAAATPFYEFEFNTGLLKQSHFDQAQKLAWVLDNMTSDKPYEFTRQALS